MNLKEISADRRLDARGYPCPRPIHITQDAIKEMQPENILEITVSDRGAKNDLQLWCKETGNEYLGSTEHDGYESVFIRKKPTHP